MNSKHKSKDIVSFLSGQEMVDDFIFDRRRINGYKSKYGQNKEVIDLLFSSESIYFKDFVYFVKKGVDQLVLAKIFNIMVKYKAIDIDSVNGNVYERKEKEETGGSFYYATKDNVYNHTISTSKAVFSRADIIKRGSNFTNYMTLFVMLHDIGKIKDIVEDYSVLRGVDEKHEGKSAIIAREIMIELGKEKEYENFLKLFIDFHTESTVNGKIVKKYEENIFGDILKMLDSDDRVKNMNKQIKKEQQEKR